MDLITFIIRVHKAFSEIDTDQSGIVTRAQAAQVMRSFGGWDSHRIALHVLAALFDADSSNISPECVFWQLAANLARLGDDSHLSFLSSLLDSRPTLESLF